MRGTMTEMEAAEALTGLAHGVPGRKRSTSYGKRSMKLVAEERERVEVVSSPIVDLAPIRPDLVQEICSGNTGKLKMEVDDPSSPHQECGTDLRNVDIMQMKTEQDSVFSDSQNQMCSMSYLPLGGGRSRHNLSEAEKEARRIRRVLANRESARRTIRRRQALYEDLTSKAADLIEENWRLKKTRELALKENESLETTNKNLKAQIVSTELKPALGNTHRVHSKANGNCHEGTSNALQLTPSITATSLCRRDLHEQEKRLNMAGPGPPVYLVPCPWFVTSCSEMRNVNEPSADNPSSSLGSDDQVIDLPPVTVKAEPPDFIVGDLNEVPIETTPLGGGSSSQFDMIPKFAKLLKPGSEGLDSVQVRSSNQENIQQTMLLGMKLGYTVTATEARRRRREITRLKNVNGHQC